MDEWIPKSTHPQTNLLIHNIYLICETFMDKLFIICKVWIIQQECIPVGCIPAAHWLYAAVFFPGGGLPGPGGGSPWSGGGGVVRLGLGGVLLGPRGGGGSPWSRGGFSLVLGGILLGPGGVSGDPPVNRITDTCKNITLATTSLRPVMI